MKKQLIESEIKRLMEIMSVEVSEGFNEEGLPDFKYYAFDWDDNLMYMPTEIMVKSFGDQEIGMGTADFAEYRGKIGKEDFDYKGHTIVGFAENPFRNFGVDGNDQFVKDAMIAKTGPSWNDFIECINGGSIFSIITARGHNPETLREGVEAIVKDGKGGLSFESCVESLKKYKGVIDGDGEELFQEYLDLCRFHPVSHGAGSAANPEEEKIKALELFIKHVNSLSEELAVTMELENDIKNNFVPMIGFSDDDKANVDNVKKYLDDKGEENVNVYYTKTDKTKM
jgi:hypothetical protein